MVKKLFKITIEETISESFDIYANNFEDAKKIAIGKYNNGDIVLSPGELIFKQITFLNTENNSETEWFEF